MSCPAKWFLVSDLASAYATHAHRTQRKVFRWLTHSTLHCFARELRPGTPWYTPIPLWLPISSEAQLAHLTFDHAHLIGATFIGANLSQATLQGAGLSGAIPYHVVLIKANLSDACLTGADLREAFLRGAFYSLNGMLEIRLYTQRVHVTWLGLAEPGMSNAGITLEENLCQPQIRPF